MAQAGFNNSLDKGLQLLHLFSNQRSRWTLADLSRAAEMPRATALRFLTAFTRNGFLRKDTAGGYALGFRLIELGSLAGEHFDLRRVALPYMTALRDELDEAVQIIVVDGDQAVYVEKVDSRQPVRLYTQVGRRAPLYGGACPRMLLAHAAPSLVAAVLAGPRTAVTPTTPVDQDQLCRLLELARRDGYTISHEELELGSAAVAVPLRDYTGQVVAALSVAGPMHRFGPARTGAIVAAAMRTAVDLSTALGYLTAAD